MVFKDGEKLGELVGADDEELEVSPLTQDSSLMNADIDFLYSLFRIYSKLMP